MFSCFLYAKINFEGKVNVLLTFCVFFQINFEGKCNAFLFFMLSKTNFEGKGNTVFFFCFLCFKRPTKTLNAADIAVRILEQLILASIKSKKRITFSLTVGIVKHRKQDTHYLSPHSCSWTTQKARNALPFSSKLILKSIKKTRTTLPFPSKLILEKHKRQKKTLPSPSMLV